MKMKNIKRLAFMLGLLFAGSLFLEACAASQPGFSGSKKKGKKVKSSGRMYR